MSSFARAFLILAVAGFAAWPAAGDVTEWTRLLPATPITSDIFSYDLAFDGRTVVGGAPFGTYSGVQQPGRAFVFELVGDSWEQTALLTPPVLQTNAWFGIGVAVDGDFLAVGAPGENSPTTDAGAVYVYVRVGGAWVPAGRLVADTPTEDASFGVSLALQGDRLIVGAPGDSSEGIPFAGAVYVFERIGGIWTQVDKLTASDAVEGDLLGDSVALDGDEIVAGAPLVDHTGVTDAGAAYVFRLVGGTWQEITRLEAGDPLEEAEFGRSVAVRGGRIVVGAPRHDTAGQDRAGAAYVFAEQGGVWSFETQLTAHDGEGGDLYGIDVDVDRGTILVGSYLNTHATGTGSTYVYQRSGGAWNFVTKVFASDPGGLLLGWRVCLRNDLAAMAAPFYQTNRGAAYVFRGLAACPADLDGDGAVGFSDLVQLLASFGTASGALLEDGDLNGDGAVGFDDMVLLLAAYGADCPG